MNVKLVIAAVVVMLLACGSVFLFPQCGVGREVCSRCHCLPLVMFMGIISLGLAFLVGISGGSKKRK